MTAPHRVTTPFTRESTAADVLAGVDLTGRRAVVTGGASGIGVETARALTAAGARVTLAVRDTDAGERVAADIAATAGRNTVAVERLELTDPASVAAFAARWQGPLHMLVNNAGVMALPDLHRTQEGWELQFATNHLGHFGLAVALHGALATAGREGGARIVSVSSSGHLSSPVVFDDIHFTHRPYEAWSAYGQSKTANVLFAVEASKRWAADGILANALMPGGIRTNLQRHQAGDRMSEALRSVEATYPWRSPEQGAATSTLLAASPLVQGVGGRYFENCVQALPYDPQVEPAWQDAPGVAAFALDPVAAERLWEVSEKLLAL
ncbi:SDR family NAD(P)-dependent oxidoreductase [Streptomyces sp. NBC_01497]|uniref:SDR family NAD(P)-dependent oxidoreductase n=1 Tax=Streptomyces sp. NBC_01497 TaxID=2903885 RepID=UPI002E338148|nr:SDR family NAD(P)-dependent oxidoreductase [Streptomyces sp. NBC_01497]